MCQGTGAKAGLGGNNIRSFIREQSTVDLGRFLGSGGCATTFFLLSLYFFLLSYCLFTTIKRGGRRVHQLRARAILLRAQTGLPGEDDQVPFLRALFRSATTSAILSTFVRDNYTIRRVGRRRGRGFRMFRMGKGNSFSRVATTFNVVGDGRE